MSNATTDENRVCVIHAIMKSILNSDFLQSLFLKIYDMIYSNDISIFEKMTNERFFSLLKDYQPVRLISHVISTYVKGFNLNIKRESLRQILSRVAFVDYILYLYDSTDIVNDTNYNTFAKNIYMPVSTIHNILLPSIVKELKCHNMFQLSKLFMDINDVCSRSCYNQDFYILLDIPNYINIETTPIINCIFLITKYCFKNNYICTDMILPTRCVNVEYDDANDEMMNHTENSTTDKVMNHNENDDMKICATHYTHITCALNVNTDIAYYSIFEEKLELSNTSYNVPLRRFLFNKSNIIQDCKIGANTFNTAFVSSLNSTNSTASSNKAFVCYNYIPTCLHLQKVYVDIGYKTEMGTVKFNDIQKQTHDDVTNTFTSILSHSPKDYAQYIDKLRKSKYEESTIML